MTETNNKKTGTNPGIVRSDSSYKQSKASEGYNPTKQVAVTALPTAENEGTFVKMYAESLQTNWLQMASSIIEERPEINMEVKPSDIKPKPVKKTHKKPEKAKSEKAKYAKTAQVKTTEKSDMDIVLSASPIIPDVPKITEEITIPEGFTVETQKPAEQSNLFAAINAIPVSPEDVDKKEERDSLKETKPYIKIDKVEIRKSVDSSGATIYMIGKDIYTSAKFEEYMQGIYGKILAGQCKKIDIEDMSYTRQSDGKYKDQSGNFITEDDMISILK